MSTKVCPKCGTEKEASLFSKNKSKKDGLNSICKICQSESNRIYRQSDNGKKRAMEASARYRQTDRYKKMAHKYNHGDKRKETLKNWNNSEKAKIAKRKYAESEKGKAKVNEKNRRYPIRRKARGRINYLVQSGKLPKITDCMCQVCGKPASSYHHYRGYSLEHWEDVIPLCYAHHKEADRSMNQQYDADVSH